MPLALPASQFLALCRLRSAYVTLEKVFPRTPNEAEALAALTAPALSLARRHEDGSYEVTNHGIGQRIVVAPVTPAERKRCA